MKDLQASPSPLHRSCLAALCLGDTTTVLQNCPIPLPGSTPGSTVPSPLPHSHALLSAFCVCPHSTPLTLSRTSSLQLYTKRDNRGLLLKQQGGPNDIPAVSAPRLGTFPPVLSKAKWAHFGSFAATRSEYQETT